MAVGRLIYKVEISNRFLLTKWTVRRRLASKSIVAPNRREFSTISRCCMTPCGTFIFAPALNGSAMNVWRTRDMELIAEYKDLCTTSDIEEGDTAPSYVAIAAYHPLDHIVAFGVYGEEQNVLIYRFDTAVTNVCFKGVIQAFYTKSICRINSFTGDRESNEKDSKMPDFSMGRFLARQKGRAMES
uniref:Uncharacterized protein n=1 Tax=Romanomermis culicivorax TaxID=13658 RepID=A0A915JXC4_ROMCU